MNAWDVLTANSTAPAGSIAWLHLNSQAGGGNASDCIDSELTLQSSFDQLQISDNSESISLSGAEGIIILSDCDDEINLSDNNEQINL